MKSDMAKVSYKEALEMLIEAIEYSYANPIGGYNDLALPVADKVNWIKREVLDKSLNTPQGLDEAAQKVEDYYDVGEERGYLCCRRGDIRDAFKAGAWWMVEQGEAKEGLVLDTDFVDFGDNTFIDICPNQETPAFNIKNGDKVIVQIRKE